VRLNKRSTPPPPSLIEPMLAEPSGPDLIAAPGMDAHAEIFAPGTLLEGKFEVRHRVGRGAMGTVYLARDVNLKRDVAVKALSVEHRNAEVVERFRSEAESMAQVDHPNVVQIYSFGEQLGTSYFVMEFLDGESLAELIDKRYLMQDAVHMDEVIGLLSQVCRGLSAIHSRGIVHRDVKPANVMITTRYRVALADFGLVGMIADGEDEEMAVFGTPIYIAPERIDTRPTPSEHAHLCDIYSLGVVLYELLTGEAPFDHEDTLTLLDMHCSAPVPAVSVLRPDLPPAMDDVIRRTMAKRPKERYQSADAFRRALLDARDAVQGVPDSDAVDEFAVVVVNADAKSAVDIVRAISVARPGANVYTAVDGKTGLEFVREVRPDLLIIDSDSPGLNALELCATLTGEQLLIGTRVLVLAPRRDPVEVSYLKDFGVVDQSGGGGEGSCRALDAGFAAQHCVDQLGDGDGVGEGRVDLSAVVLRPVPVLV